jgi:hypothetical protein
MEDGETSADSTSVQHQPEVEPKIFAAVDAQLVELVYQREVRVRAAIDPVVNQLISQLSAEGIDADRSELAAWAYWAARDERRLRGPLPEIQGPLEFIGTAVAGGILGNLAYDALKVVVRRLARRRHSASGTEALAEIVLFAVAEMCRRYRLHVDPSKLRVRKWQLSSAYAVAKIDAEGSELTAEVTVPYKSWRTDGVNVRIRDVSQSDEIARAAKNLYETLYEGRWGSEKKLRDRFEELEGEMRYADGISLDSLRHNALRHWHDAEWAQIVTTYDKEKYKYGPYRPRD